MPGSFPVFDELMRHALAWIDPRSALDVGAGAGKYGRLLREIAPACETTGVEVDQTYIERFALRDVYTRIEVCDVTGWWQQSEQLTFDLVILGDCLQIMTKSAGADLLNAMVYRCGWLIVLVPEFVVQGAADTNRNEVHRSVWSERDFRWHDLWAWENARAMTLVILRGYRESTITLDSIVDRVNEQSNIPLLDFDGTTQVRPCRLRLIDQARETAYRLR
jgi:trans-aconitate methyltransferase